MRVTTVDDRCRLFFSTFFRRFRFFRFFRKRVSGQMLRKTFWVVQGGPGSFLGHPGGVREAFWGVLGLSGGLRGASWEGLGRSWGDLGATLEAVRFRVVFLIDFERQKGAQREAFWEPKWSQNRSQNDSKSKSIFKSEKIPFKTVLETSWSRLGPILGHLDRARGHIGAILGRLGEPKPLIFLRIFTIFEKSRFCIKMVILAGLEAILGRLGAILGPLGLNLGRFGRPRGPKREAKMGPRGAQNETKMTSKF
jgi:hypothetical protein